MKTTITFNDFCDSFSQDKYTSNYTGQFTYEAKRALFDYLERLEEDMGKEIDFDIIAICCDFTEFEDFEELQGQYPQITTMSELEDKTTVIPCDNGHVIIQNF